MDLQTYLQTCLERERKSRFKQSDQLPLGELIAKLEPIAKKQNLRIEEGFPESIVVFDFGDLFPTNFSSWRGIYRELALQFSERKYSPKNVEPMTVTAFLKMCERTVGETFTGYKGGEFRMDESTPVWVANYGNSGNTALIDVIDDGYKTVLITGYREP